MVRFKGKKLGLTAKSINSQAKIKNFDPLLCSHIHDEQVLRMLGEFERFC